MKARKIILFFVRVLFLISVIVIVISAQKVNERRTCNALHIDIRRDCNGDFLVDTTDVMKIIYENDIPVSKAKQTDITHIIEQHINKQSAVRTANVYLTVDGNLGINVNEHKPIALIEDINHNKYYLSSIGSIIRYQPKQYSRVIIINGNVRSENMVRNEIFDLVTQINKDEFLSRFIDGIYVEEDDNIELISKVDGQIIRFGDINNTQNTISDKLKCLKGYYTKVVPEAGLKNYKAIDLRFKNQVVCIKN